jgi:hypothetical protein
MNTFYEPVDLADPLTILLMRECEDDEGALDELHSQFESGCHVTGARGSDTIRRYSSDTFNA